MMGKIFKLFRWESILLIVLSFFWVNTNPVLALTETYQWTKTIGGTQDFDIGYSILVDSSNNIYLTGSFRGTVDFDPSGSGTENRTAVGLTDIFLSKYTSDGQYLWTKTMGGAGSDVGRTLIIDGNNNLFLLGYFSNTVDFDPNDGSEDNRTSNGDVDIFLSKYSLDGTYLWTKTMGGGGKDQGASLVVDSTNNLYFTGVFRFTVDFDPSDSGTDSRTVSGQGDGFLTKYSSDGTYLWTKTMGSTGYDSGISLTIDTANNLYLSGSFQGTVDFDPSDSGADNQASAGDYDIFLSKYTSDGVYVWTKVVGGTGADLSQQVSVDSNGNLYHLSYFSGTADFNPSSGVDNKTSQGSYDIALSKYDLNGNYSWTKVFGGTGDEYNSYYGSFAIDSNNNLYLTGSFLNTVDFDPSDSGTDNKTSAGAADIFITSYNHDGSYNWVKTVGSGGSNNDRGLGITIDSQDNLYSTGYFKGTVDFDPSDSGTDNKTSAGAADIFITKYSIHATPPSLSFGSSPAYYASQTPGIPGQASEATTLVSNVQFQVDTSAGSWANCTASDGSFDAALENFSCQISNVLSEGAHTLYLRATDTANNTSSMFTSYNFTIDLTLPLTNWTSNDGGARTFSSPQANVFSTSLHLPSFSFTKAKDTTAGISKYQILIKPEGKEYYTYIDDIPPDPSGAGLGTILDETNRYLKYSGDDIFVHSKRTQDQLANGGYKWKVRVLDKAGNQTDTEEKIFLINTHSAVFSKTWFPLVLLSTKPSFYGITTVDSKVTLELKQNNQVILTKQTIANPESRFGINLTKEDNLKTGEYSVLLSAANLQGDYIELPEFKYTYGKKTLLKVAGAKTSNPEPQPQPEADSEADRPLDETPPKPTLAPKPRHCFLFWCW